MEKGEEIKAFNSGINTFCDIMRYRMDTILKEIVDSFKQFSLSDFALREIERFFTFKLNYGKGHRRELRYNLLLQCENDDEALEFIDKINWGLNRIGVLSKLAIIKTEEDLEYEMPSGFPEACSILSIHNCRPIEKDTVAIVASSIRAERQSQREDKDNLWKEVKRLADKSPDCTVIAVGPKGFIDYIRESDELYYRFFAHHIFLRPMTIEEIISATYKEIRKEKLLMEREFEIGIEKYIRVVYPKADLKDRAFVNDLINRILVNYYLKPTGGEITEACIPFYRRPKTYEEISGQLEQLVGLQSVKKQFRNLYQLSQDSSDKNKRRLHFAFVGNPGTGKTTVANLTANLLFSMGLIKKNKVVVVAPTDVISVYRGESGQLMREKINEARGGVLFVDEAYFLISSTNDANSHQKQCLEVLLQEMENHSDELSVIFAGYKDEIETLLKSNPGLTSRVPYRFEFEDYTEAELLQIFLDLAASEGMSLEENAYEVMEDRIALAKTEEDFGNARTIANIYQQLKAIWLERNSQERVFTAADVRAIMPLALNEDLDEMIGLESVKQELKLFESRIKYLKYLKDENVTVPDSNIHMMFTGNPGTGKTTVAKKIADCLYQIGVLKTNKLIVAERKDLVDSYIGGTAAKTNELIRKAMNGVLFIDEAYSLYRADDPKDYGTEAIAALITAMESYKGQLIVIFAGYQREMRVFLNANPGILSRIGFTFHFPDYTPSELTEMFYVKMTKSGFIVDTKALTHVMKLVEYFSKMEYFGNGRFVDRIIDMTISNRSLRSYAKRHNDITEIDIPEIKDMIRVSSNAQNLWTDEEQSDEKRKRIAIHEAGHALVSKILFPSRKINVVSINADAVSMGKAVMEYSQDNDTEIAMKSQLAIALGGRNAERLVLGTHSAGCESDVMRAKALATYMIERLAMGELGVTTEMELLQEADKVSMEVLAAHKEKLVKISELLCEKGTITGEEFDEIVVL